MGTHPFGLLLTFDFCPSSIQQNAPPAPTGRKYFQHLVNSTIIPSIVLYKLLKMSNRQSISAICACVVIKNQKSVHPDMSIPAKNPIVI